MHALTLLLLCLPPCLLALRTHRRWRRLSVALLALAVSGPLAWVALIALLAYPYWRAHRRTARAVTLPQLPPSPTLAALPPEHAERASAVAPTAAADDELDPDSLWPPPQPPCALASPDSLLDALHDVTQFGIPDPFCEQPRVVAMATEKLVTRTLRECGFQPGGTRAQALDACYLALWYAAEPSRADLN